MMSSQSSVIEGLKCLHGLLKINGISGQMGSAMPRKRRANATEMLSSPHFPEFINLFLQMWELGHQKFLWVAHRMAMAQKNDHWLSKFDSCLKEKS